MATSFTMQSQRGRRLSTILMWLVPVVIVIFIIYQIELFFPSTHPDHLPTDMPLTYFERNSFRIMPLGDSITSSVYPPAKSYRYFLWHTLRRALDQGVTFDFVGSMRGTQFQQVKVGEETDEWRQAYGDADMDHEGHWGWRIEGVLENINNWLDTYRPDVVLLHLGTNNLEWGEATPAAGLLSSLIDAIRGHPQGRTIKLFVALLIPSNKEEGVQPTKERIKEYNREIATIIKAKNAANKEQQTALTSDDFHRAFTDKKAGVYSVAYPFDIDIVDLNSLLDRREDFHDHVHPSTLGEEKMAVGWWNGLKDSDWWTLLLKAHPNLIL